MLAPADLLDGVPEPVVSPDGAVSGTVVLVDLDQPLGTDQVEPLQAALRGGDTGVVGVATAPLSAAARAIVPALDTTVCTQESRTTVAVDDPQAVGRALAANVLRAPRAAMVLLSLLRQTAQLDVPEGLAAEAAAYSTLLGGPEFAAWLRHRGPPRRAEAGGRLAPRVRVEQRGQVLHVRLVRPARRNAMDAAMREELGSALTLARLEGLSVVLDGDGPVFSAGGDLDEFGSAADPATAWVVRVATHPGRALWSVPGGVEARVHGNCVGAGVELAAFARRVVAAPGTTFTLPELELGLLPGAGGTVSVARRIGRWRTAYTALTGARIDAGTALRWGLVDEVRP